MHDYAVVSPLFESVLLPFGKIIVGRCQLDASRSLVVACVRTPCHAELLVLLLTRRCEGRVGRVRCRNEEGVNTRSMMSEVIDIGAMGIGSVRSGGYWSREVRWEFGRENRAGLSGNQVLVIK